MSEPRLTVLRESCDACPFKGRLQLGSGRLRELAEQCRDGDATFVCHKTLVGDGTSPVWDEGVAVCAGWLEAARRAPLGPPTIIQVSERLNLIEWVDP
jgi:hypothetical protein